MYWTLFLLLLSNLELSFATFTDTMPAHIPVAANDHMVVFASDRYKEFYITLSPYATPTVILPLNYKEVETETVRSLVIPTTTSPLGLTELVFIGERSNSSENTLFRAKLRVDVRNDKLRVVHLEHKSLASLSSDGVECALGIHPRGTHVFVVGDRAALVYEMNESLVYH